MGALLDAFPQAMALVFDPYTLGVGLLATIFGLFVGAMPGLTATMAVALLTSRNEIVSLPNAPPGTLNCGSVTTVVPGGIA